MQCVYKRFRCVVLAKSNFFQHKFIPKYHIMSRYLPLGILFAEQGSMYLVHQPNKARLIDLSTDTPTGIVVDIENQHYKIIGAVMINIPLQIQMAYMISRSIFYEKKYNNALKKNQIIMKQIVKCIKQSLLDLLSKSNMGLARDIFICSVGKITFEDIKTQLLMYTSDWKRCSVSILSNYVSTANIKLLLGKKYPILIGKEIITIEGLRFQYIHKSKHIRHKQLRMKVNIVGTHKDNGRVIGALREKEIKKKAKRKQLRNYVKIKTEKKQRNMITNIFIRWKGYIGFENDYNYSSDDTMTIKESDSHRKHAYLTWMEFNEDYSTDDDTRINEYKVKKKK
eukprot:373551_1